MNYQPPKLNSGKTTLGTCLSSQPKKREMNTLISNWTSPLHFPSQFRANTSNKITRTKRKKLSISVSLNDVKEQDQQLNLSVLRFTLGIRGLDESNLPRWIGYTFGSLLFLNHFIGSYSPTTPAQLRSEAMGLSLAAFSIVIPYLGKFLKGAPLVDQPILPEGNKQIFSMSESVSGMQKEDLAWGTYVLLKNTNTISVLISVREALCVRGYWSIPEEVSSAHILDWFEREVQLIGLSNLKDTLYFPQSEDSGVWEFVPKGTRSLLIQPVLGASEVTPNETKKKIRGFILLASSMSYAYGDRDRAWIGAVANKFRENVACIDF